MGVTPAPAASVPDSVYEAIRSTDYDRASRLLRNLKSHPETLFLSGVTAFRKGNYSTAQSRFRRVVDRSDSTNVRRKDALYYLDRLKLYDVETDRIPRIRVRVGRDTTPVTFDSDARVKLVVDGNVRGQTRASRIRVKNSMERIEVNRMTGSTIRSKRVRLRPVSQDVVSYEGVKYRGVIVLSATDRGIDVINELPLNSYLYGVVRKELAPGWPMAVLKAQAVASRSFALDRILRRRSADFHVSATSSSQVYGGKDAETKRIKRAVDQTRGEVLVHQGRVVPAYFHANSGGYIESPGSVWGGRSRAFIEPKRDKWSLRADYDRWTNRLTIASMNRGLTSAGHPAVNSDQPSIRVAKTLTSGRAKTIRYNSVDGTETLSANDFRVAVGAGKMKSTWITNIRRRGDEVVFSGRGWGHGVGMSQWGARKMAESGKSYGQILSFYFEPTRILGEFGPARVASVTGEDD